MANFGPLAAEIVSLVWGTIITQICRAISFATQACIDNREKLVKQQYLLHVPHSMVNFGPLAA